MGFLKSESGVSITVGAMLILFIFVLYLGILQAYEVPALNKKLEKDHFDSVYSDFVALRREQSDAALKNVPQTGSMRMGVRYHERFMLMNPGQGAYGSLTASYPLNISVNYSNGIKPKNYTSLAIQYKMEGTSDYPALIYENGLLIKSSGNSNFTDELSEPLTTDYNIFIPIINGSLDPAYSMDIETLNIFPLPLKNYTQPTFNWTNVTIETRYPDVWKTLSSASRPAGSNYMVESNKTNCKEVNTGYGCIKITKIPGFNVKRLELPPNDAPALSENQLYTGMITIDQFKERGATGAEGQDVWGRMQGRNDIPGSNDVKEFVIRNIKFSNMSTTGAKLEFSVKDINKEWNIEMLISPMFGGTSLQKSVCGISRGHHQNLDLTACYRNANITTPNVLVIVKIEEEIQYVNFLIN